MCEFPIDRYISLFEPKLDCVTSCRSSSHSTIFDNLPHPSPFPPPLLTHLSGEVNQSIYLPHVCIVYTYINFPVMSHGRRSLQVLMNFSEEIPVSNITIKKFKQYSNGGIFKYSVRSNLGWGRLSNMAEL